MNEEEIVTFWRLVCGKVKPARAPFVPGDGERMDVKLIMKVYTDNRGREWPQITFMNGRTPYRFNIVPKDAVIENGTEHQEEHGSN